MKDILPELLEKIEADFEKDFINSKKIKAVIAKIKSKNATYKEANQLAVEVGEILAKAFKKHISSDVLPDGKMYYNIANRMLNKTLANNHDIVAKTCANIQTNLNKSAKMGVKGIAPELNQDRIDGLIEKVVQADNYDDVAWVLDEPVVNYSQSIVNDAIRENVEFHHSLGIHPKITRLQTGKCCDWCANLVGVCDYPDVPKDIYRIHRHCRCVVDYSPSKGRVQDVITKKWLDPDGIAKRDERIRKYGQQVKNQRIKFNKKNLLIHYERHKDLYPDLTMEEYKELAEELLNSDKRGGIIGYETKEGAVVRYDLETNDFVKGYKTGIATMFKPKAKLKYYLRKRQEDL